MFFEKKVKHRLIEIEKNQEWLAEQVKLETGMYFDRQYLRKILTGKISNDRFKMAICTILDIDVPEESLQLEEENVKFCCHCGMQVSGNFCSNCGAIIGNRLKNYRKTERQYQENFEKSVTCNSKGEEIPEANHQLASACWYASTIRFGYENNVRILTAGDDVPDEAFERLKNVKEQATKLYLALLRF